MRQICALLRGIGMNPLLFLPGSMVRVIKRATSKNALFPSASWDEWIPGQPSKNNVSLPIDFQFSGLLLEYIQVGHPIEVFRVERNGVYVSGFFRSSQVIEIDEFERIVTINSVYEITPIAIHELRKRRDAIFQ